VYLIQILQAEKRHTSGRLIDSYFPDSGPYRLDLYPKHLEFFDAGKTYRERCFMAGNRVGKTIAGGVEVTYHLTGAYPHWWDGYRLDRPARVLVAGDTTQTTKDILQAKLLGDFLDMGGGLIPRECIGPHTSKSGVAQGVESIKVKHVSGGWSTLKLRSYEQGRKIFQGTEEDLIWFDEEPPLDVYNESLVRTMTTGGRTILTFTPLMGMSDTVMTFLPKEYQLSA
jgi:phage terminase large subunit-like protein